VKKYLLTLLLLTASCQVLSEEIRYIRDELYVPLRSGQSPQHRIVHKGLISGTKLTILETSADGDYSRVRTRKGTEGWIQTQYLSPEPAAKNVLKIANANLAKLQQENIELKQQLKQLGSKDRETQNVLSELEASNQKMAKELADIKAISADAIQLNEDNHRLLESNQILKNEIDILSTDNKRLTDNKENDAFLNGAFAVLIGVMLTLLIPRAWPKKSTDWA